MRCSIYGCVTHTINPITGEKIWYNFCPVCNKLLDR